MTDLEQITAEAVNALKLNPHMSAWDKAMLCYRIETMAADAYRMFMEMDIAEEEARDAA